MLVLFLHPCWAGLDRYTELDRVKGWLIERKQGADGALSCRAFLPSGASWFSGNIHLDANAELVVPAGRSFKGIPNSWRQCGMPWSVAKTISSICRFEEG